MVCFDLSFVGCNRCCCWWWRCCCCCCSRAAAAATSGLLMPLLFSGATAAEAEVGCCWLLVASRAFADAKVTGDANASPLTLLLLLACSCYSWLRDRRCSRRGGCCCEVLMHIALIYTHLLLYVALSDAPDVHAACLGCCLPSFWCLGL